MRYSIEVDAHNPEAMTNCMVNLANNILDFAYDWRLYINAGGIDYGTYINIDTAQKTITLCNQPEGDEAYLDDVIQEIVDEQEEEA